MLCSQVETIFWRIQCSIMWINFLSGTLLLIMSLISNRNVDNKWDGSSTNMWSIIDDQSLIIDSLSWSPSNHYLMAVKIIVIIREAHSNKKSDGQLECLDVSDWAPYFCMLLVWFNGVIQHQRPFGMVYWIDSLIYPMPSSIISRA